MQACIVVERRFWLRFSIGGAVGEDGSSYFFFFLLLSAKTFLLFKIRTDFLGK